MIETPRAVTLAEEFLAIDGVDGILVGSNDLRTDLGLPGQYDNPVYQESVTRIVQAGTRAGKPVGIGVIGGRRDLLEKWFNMGATWSLSGADGTILQTSMQEIGRAYSDINHRVQRQRHLVVNDVDKVLSSSSLDASTAVATEAEPARVNGQQHNV